MNNSPETTHNKSIKQGDLYQIGKHRLLCADATNAKSITALLESNQVDLVLTDPPYGVSYVESKQDFNLLAKSKRIQNDQEQSESEYQVFSEQWIAVTLPFLAQRNSLYIFNSDKMLFGLRKAMETQQIKFSQLLIWAKHQAVVGRLDYLPQHELIIYGWYGTHRFHKSKDKSLLFCPKPHRSSLHPTMKPVSLLRRLILNSTEVGNIIYDPFGGSGSTLMAAEQTKRRCFTVELDPEYCATILKRWEQLTKQQSIFITNIYGN